MAQIRPCLVPLQKTAPPGQYTAPKMTVPSPMLNPVFVTEIIATGFCQQSIVDS